MNNANDSLGSSLELHVILTYSGVSCKFNVCVDRFICEEEKVLKNLLDQ